MTEPPASDVYDSVPLPPGNTMCIRVIKISPSTTSDFSDTIVCDFSVLNIDNGTLVGNCRAPEPSDYHGYTESPYRPMKFDPMQYDIIITNRVRYRALSYTWGESPADCIIKLDGTHFNVRQNLWDFLNRVRHEEVTNYLWIDAVCNNQEIKKERNHQVGIMGEIYSRAECVIVWLGEGCLRVVQALNIRYDAYCQSGYADISEDYQLKREVIDDFCFLPYWSRAWIVQEYSLAKRKEIWYGCLRMPSSHVERMMDLWKTGPFSLFEFDETPAARLLSRVKTPTWRDIKRSSPDIIGLPALFELF